MPRSPRLLACPACACHVKASEPRCPHCDAAIRKADGSVQRTAAALLLGLSTSVAACGERDVVSPVYGSPATGGAGGTTMGTGAGGEGGTGGTAGASMGGTGGTAGASMGGTAGASMGGAGGGGGAGGTAGSGGDTNIPVYGAAPTGGSGGAPRQ